MAHYKLHFINVKLELHKRLRYSFKVPASILCNLTCALSVTIVKQREQYPQGVLLSLFRGNFLRVKELFNLNRMNFPHYFSL